MSKERIDKEKNPINFDRLEAIKRETQYQYLRQCSLKAAATCKSRGNSTTTAHECDAAAIYGKNQEEGDKATHCSHL